MSSTPSDSVSTTPPLGTLQSQSVMDSSVEDKLLAALESGDFQTALQLLPKDSPSPPTVGPDNLTPLHYACQHGRTDIALLLITKYNYSTNSRSKTGQTPLHFAAKYGQLDVMKLLVQQSRGTQPSEHTGAGSSNAINTNSVSPSSFTDEDQSTSKQFLKMLFLSAADNDGNIPLHLAAAHGHLHLTKYLIHDAHCNPAPSNNEKQTPLHLAAMHGHLEEVQYLVEKEGCDPSPRDEYGRTPLYLAAGSGQLEVVKYLITETQCDPNCKTTTRWEDGRYMFAPGMTPLQTASREGHLDVVKYLVNDCKCNPSCANEDGVTPLYLAAQQGCTEVVKFFISEKGCDPMCRGLWGRTPLHGASQGGHLDIVKYLIDEQHVDPSCLDVEDKVTPLKLASNNGHLPVVKFLTEEKACDPLHKDKLGNTPLHGAALGGSLEVVTFFINEKGCDPMCRGEWGRTPLHFASDYGHLEIVKYLIDEQHVDPSCPDNNNDTPLHVAALGGSLEVVTFFISEKGCDPMCRGQLGRTPLHHASDKGHLDIVKYLIDEQHVDPSCLDVEDKVTPLRLASNNGHLAVVKFFTEEKKCDPLHKDKHGGTPLHGAAFGGSLEVVKFFISENGCDPMCRGQLGRTPLHRASERGHLEIVKYLIDGQQAYASCPANDNVTPLHVASKNGHLDVIKYLVDRKHCDPAVKVKDGRTPVDLAFENSHTDVIQYLISKGGTLSRYVLEKGVAISPLVKIHVVGNSGSGKSSLVEALQYEDSPITGRLFNVSGIIPKTSGIIPVEFQSKNFGEVTLYDFAGHEEYYAGHESIFENTSLPIFLLTVNLYNPPDKIRKAIDYWESLIGNAVSTSVHVIAIGSHSDELSARDLQMKSTILSEVMDSPPTFKGIKHAGWATLDCRKSSSAGISKLRRYLQHVCKSVRIEANFDYKNAAVLNAVLNKQLINMKACTFTELLTGILESGDPNLEQLKSPPFLFQTCESLNKSGHVLFLKHKERPEESWLVLNKEAILSDVHGLLKQVQLSSTSGIVSQSQLRAILKNARVGLHIDLVRRYLVQMKFCIEIESHLLELIGGSELPHIRENCFLFPDLLSENRPSDVWQPNPQFTYYFGWGLKCTEPSHFFTPRFLQVLLIHLASRFALNPHPESPDLLEPAQGCRLWKNGIRWQDGWGVEVIVEITDQNTALNVIARCLKGSEMKLIQTRSSIIQQVLNTKDHTCSKVTPKEYSVHPNSLLQQYSLTAVGTEIPISQIADAISMKQPYLLTDCSHSPRNSGYLPIAELLHFEPYHNLSVELLQQLFDKQNAGKVMPEPSLYLVAQALQNEWHILEGLPLVSEEDIAQAKMDGALNEAQKCLNILNICKKENRTYGNLHHILDQYSIFAGRNPLAISPHFAAGKSLERTVFAEPPLLQLIGGSDLPGDRPTDVWQLSQQLTYSYYCGWGLRCMEPFFTPETLQILLIHLASRFALNPHPESPGLLEHAQGSRLWKNGVHWRDGWGIEVIVEISDQNTALNVIMRCLKGSETKLIQMRSSIIRQVFNARSYDQKCSEIKPEEFLIHPSDLQCYPIPIQEVTKFPINQIVDVVSKKKTHLVIDSGRHSGYLPIRELLHFEPYLSLSTQLRQQLFDEQNAGKAMPEPSLYIIAQALENKWRILEDLPHVSEEDVAKVEMDGSLDEAQKCFRILTISSEKDSRSYGNLRQILDQYSIFAGRNPLTISPHLTPRDGGASTAAVPEAAAALF